MTRSLMRVTRRAALCAAAITAVAAAGTATPLAPEPAAAVPDNRPPQCADRFRDPDPRERTIDVDNTQIHAMSDRCFPYGQYRGRLSLGSTFIVYHADPVYSDWCYGYSVQTATKGYILCSSLSAP